ncbi:hypothetical protein VTK56DRAFT_2742 [Thermocarpiscus australiensis]
MCWKGKLANRSALIRGSDQSVCYTKLVLIIHLLYCVLGRVLLHVGESYCVKKSLGISRNSQCQLHLRDCKILAHQGYVQIRVSKTHSS